ncbi:primosomal protein N' [Acinetobacter brisouii]|uniref:primosomal protein N' n=1 Tax=Acinetobacter brisouii TaxID=396323 RepID=UPI0035B15EA0
MPLPFRIRVAIPVHLYDCFDYTLSAEQYQQAEMGARVAVPFGARHCIGIIVEKLAADEPLDPRFELKAIHALLDQHSLLDANHLKLLHWAALYYHFPIGEVLPVAFPTLLRQGKPYDILAKIWVLTDPHVEVRFKNAHRQQEAYKILKLKPHGTPQHILNASGIENKTLEALAQKGIARAEYQHQEIKNEPVQLAQLPLKANADQSKAIQTILKAQDHFQAFLLDGITGSGKTEVYLQVMHEVLKKGKQVLVLVPEIGLTPQTIHRFQSRFHGHTVMLHSGLSDAQRLQAWQQAQIGHAAIILGTRSAIFTPLPNLGLIILDEEHDLSFKQQEGFRYHTREVALYRAHLQHCPIILGSATPSMESYALVEQGKLTHLQLNQRAGHALLPQMHVIDLKIAQKQHGLSQQLIQQIRQRLEKKQQVLIFLNRRGYAPVLICEQCAWQANCPHCDAHFTLHTKPYQHLHCHHCGLVQRLPERCPACNHDSLKPIGMGTVKIEEALQELFPEYPVLRVDRDSTSRVGSWQKLYDQIQQNQPLILLGTQMLAKGHHFPYVSLVALLDIDAGLLSVDFRATERTAQLIIQVAGRAGRGEHKGDVLIQTLRPEHPLFHMLLEKDYRYFAQHTLKERKLAQFPPYRYSMLVRSQARNATDNQAFLQQIANQLRSASGNEIEIWGPIPAPMERKAGRNQAHLLLLATDRARLHMYVRSWWAEVMQQQPKNIRVSIDVDPQELN